MLEPTGLAVLKHCILERQRSTSIKKSLILNTIVDPQKVRLYISFLSESFPNSCHFRQMQLNSVMLASKLIFLFDLAQFHDSTWPLIPVFRRGRSVELAGGRWCGPVRRSKATGGGGGRAARTAPSIRPAAAALIGVQRCAGTAAGSQTAAPPDAASWPAANRETPTADGRRLPR